MNDSSRRLQRGVAVVAMLAILVLGSVWWLVASVSVPANRTADKRAHNAKVLQQAKAALIGYVAQQAARSDENDPGSLPCPEAAGNIGTANEGVAAGNCTLPAVGRLPWRTLGLDKLHDASTEPLWYVVSPGWAKPNATTNTVINSNSTGQLTLDTTTTDVVALIIAPGPVLRVAGSNCQSWDQIRSTPSPSIDFRNYLECQNATFPADADFVSNRPDASFNDHVLAVTAAETLPAIEAAIAARFARDLAPSLRAAYCGGPWAPCSGAGSAVYLPFAVPFGNPATSNFQGSAGTTQGLLPLSYGATQGCLANTPSAPFCAPPPACNPAADNRCRPSFVVWRNNPVITRTGGANLSDYSCSVAGTPSTITCTLNTSSNIFTPNLAMTFTMAVTVDNIGMAFRQLNTAVQMTGVDTTAAGVNLPFGYSVGSAAMNTDGSATIQISSRVPAGAGTLVSDLICLLTGGLALTTNCYQHTITLPFMLVDQPILYPSDTTSAWFYRNRWHETMYYAVAPGNAPSGTGTCTAGTNCLSVTGLTPSNTQRSLAVVPGPRLSALGQARPPGSRSDWLEGSNADGDSAFALRDPSRLINRTFNDHIAVIDSN